MMKCLKIILGNSILGQVCYDFLKLLTNPVCRVLIYLIKDVAEITGNRSMDPVNREPVV